MFDWKLKTKTLHSTSFHKDTTDDFILATFKLESFSKLLYTRNISMMFLNMVKIVPLF